MKLDTLSARITASVLLPALFLCSPGIAARGRIFDASWQKTFDAYRQVPCLTQEELQYGAEVILGLDYNSQRLFRQISKAQGMDFEKSRQIWSLLISSGLSYEQVLCYEKWSDLDGITVDLAIAALTDIKTLAYEAGRSFTLYCSLPRVTPDHALKTIPLLNRLNDLQNQALQGLLSVEDITAEQALDGIGRISRMHDHQARAVGAFARLSGMTMAKIKDATDLILLLNPDNAWNAGTLFRGEGMNADEAWFWLVAYFANPTEVQEQQFRTLSDQRKATLVRAMYEGGTELVWKINNLHAITDWYGLEISNAELQGYSAKQLQSRFTMLSPRIQSRFGDRFYQAGSNASRIAVLKEATAADRVETARQLTTANIYALLAQGSELYDSSFRNILVPVLQEHVARSFNNNLLVFLRATDPGNQLVSNFIVSLAQKGKMTVFFPDNPREQEQILELVSESAFKDEDSVILFSATFMHLLEVLAPSARTYLLTRMITQADTGSVSYARLIRVILQYYLEEFPELLGSGDKEMITGLITRHGAVNLRLYQITPFAEWKEDGVLKSISVFHPDDDGRDSFLSNARTLMASGYRLSLSEEFTLDSVTDQQRRQAQAQIRNTANLAGLFTSMRRIPFAVSFVRTVNGVTINHAAFVYSGQQNQEQLMARFILGGAEMFAQRGHSYWRSEQITDPLDKLLKAGRLTDAHLQAKQRFLSLGSCGGVKAYTHLNQMFRGHVDILATIGTGLANINDPYNKNFFEVIAGKPSSISWKGLAGELAFIFRSGQGRDYLQPGSLTAIMHKILDEEKAARTEQRPAPGEQSG
ncbi:MAG: hypothetical protein C4563_03340 [Desulfobulbus sp.]|nr:MAG: hypothetical protein C4563_03340 [Desulfobulbus sp.]